MTERIRRAFCRWFGHGWVLEERADPVTVFALCRRCGKVGPRIERALP